jgi:hypothetical protein
LFLQEHIKDIIIIIVIAGKHMGIARMGRAEAIE